jgi:tRNA/tmRNA/rRNA uracil-C5-methylase (TrmA/RlmC/RlmD family)
VHEQVPEGSRVAEFYAGVGAIGLSVLPRVAELRMNEVSPHSLQGLAAGLAALTEAERSKVSVVAGTAGDARHAVSNADVVIADPPRRGLDRTLLEFLCEHPPARFVYVSCGLESFLADTARLTAATSMRLVDLRAYNLMPYTEHVETVACFERV